MARKAGPFTPTLEQERIAGSTAGRIVIEANAGVGKTTALCLRALRMFKEGADPARVLMLSFSEPGSQAIDHALKALGAPAATRKSVRRGTFDDFCAARLRRSETSTVKILTRPEEVRPFVLAAISQARATAEVRFPGAFALEGTGELAVESLLRDFERIKGSMVMQRQDEGFRLTPDSAADTGFDYTSMAVFIAYEHTRADAGPAGDRERWRYQGDATYDLACQLLAAEPDFLLESHPLRLGELHAIFVDEFHDMNWAMATVLRELLVRFAHVPFTGVGDVDQVIHAASGAEAYFLRHGFEREFGAAERMKLTQAQRFGPAIADALAAFAGKPYPSNPARQGRIEAVPVEDTLALALHVERVLGTRAAEPAPARAEVAMLLRHPNAALDLEYELLNRGIDYETSGFVAYMRRPEVLFVRMILAAAVGLDEAFSDATLEAAKRATWQFIGGALPTAAADDDPQTASKIDNASLAGFQNDMLASLLERTPRQRGARRVREAMALASDDRIDSLIPALRALDMPYLAGKVFVHAEAVRDAADSVMALDRMVQRSRFNAIVELLRTIKLQEERQLTSSPNQRMVLSTIAQAKGLEFDHVIIPGLNRGEFDGHDEDERHLFYVAVSRARRVVELVYRPGAASAYVPTSLLRAKEAV